MCSISAASPSIGFMGGGASYTGSVKGWPTEGGGGKPINNVDLPKTIHLRWQSLVEPQAYKVLIDIPQWAVMRWSNHNKYFVLGIRRL
jgi:hypothetical protein